MEEPQGGRPTATGAFAVAALAIAGLAFAWTPLAERLDEGLLDSGFAFLRKVALRPAPDDILIVGVDDATFRAIPDPLGMWHQPLGAALGKIAAAKPRAIGLDVALPERSFDAIRPGLDRALLEGLVAARANGPVAAVLTIDSRTRAAKPIHTPFLAVLGPDRLSIGMFGRDGDGTVRRFSLAVPIEDGSFPTLAGRLCRALSKRCADGLIDFALGEPFRYVPLQQVLESDDEAFLGRLFRDRIVLLGETQRFSDRIAVPLNLAGWEAGGRDSPGVVVHAQALRTALHGNPPEEAGRPVVVLLVSVAALLALMRDWRLALLTGILAAVALMAMSLAALRSGTWVAISPALFTLALAWASRTAYEAWQERRTRLKLRAGFAGYVSPAVLGGILRGEIAAGRVGERRALAFVFADLRGSTAMTAATSPEEAMALLNRFHEAIVSAVHRHEGMLDNIRGDGIMAVFGAPKALADPCGAAWSAVQDMFRGLDRLNGELAREGRAPFAMGAGMAFGEAVVGHVGSRERFNYTAVGDSANVAARLQDQAKRLGLRAVVSGEAKAHLAGAPLEPLGAIAIEGREPVEAWGWRG